MSLHTQLQYEERDFKSEYLFRMCIVVTNLVTSLDFKSIRCTTTLCHFGQTRNDSAANHPIFPSRTESSSAKGNNIVVSGRFPQNKKLAEKKMRNELGKSLVPFGKKHLNN